MNDLKFRLYDLTVDEYVYFSESYAPNFRHDGIIMDLDGDDFKKLCCNLAGAGVGCFVCNRYDGTKSTTWFIDTAKGVHGDRYDYSKVVYTAGNVNVEIICSVHGSFMQLANRHINVVWTYEFESGEPAWLFEQFILHKFNASRVYNPDISVISSGLTEIFGDDVASDKDSLYAEYMMEMGESV
jgi:hypothetical protein